MQDTFLIDPVIEILKNFTKQSPELMTQEIVFLYGRDPYLILISCLLSLQARDTVTLPVSLELFKIVTTPQEMVMLPLIRLEQTIKSINYFKTKAQCLHSVSKELLERFDGNVPCDLGLLLSIKGIGLKTANLVLAQAFGIPAICVDTHVHRLSNHWGMVSTKTPEQTEAALRMIVPEKHWIEWSYLLVKWGQSVCKSKQCSVAACDEIFKATQSRAFAFLEL